MQEHAQSISHTAVVGGHTDNVVYDSSNTHDISVTNQTDVVLLEKSAINILDIGVQNQNDHVHLENCATFVVPSAPQITNYSADHSMRTRAKSGIVKPNPKYALHTEKTSDSQPKSVKEAMSQQGWLEAMLDEPQFQEDNHT